MNLRNDKNFNFKINRLLKLFNNFYFLNFKNVVELTFNDFNNSRYAIKLCLKNI